MLCERGEWGKGWVGCVYITKIPTRKIGGWGPQKLTKTRNLKGVVLLYLDDSVPFCPQ